MNRILEVLGLAAFAYVLVMLFLLAAGNAAPPPRHVQPARYVKLYICPQRPDGSEVRNRNLCAIERWRRW